MHLLGEPARQVFGDVLQDSGPSNLGQGPGKPDVGFDVDPRRAVIAGEAVDGGERSPAAALFVDTLPPDPAGQGLGVRVDDHALALESRRDGADLHPHPGPMDIFALPAEIFRAGDAGDHGGRILQEVPDRPDGVLDGEVHPDFHAADPPGG